MNYGVVHTSKVKACKVGHIYSVVSAEDIQNGSVGFVGDLKENATENREFVKPTTELIGKGEVVIIATPELIYDQSRKASGCLRNFINETGDSMVAIPLEKGDELEVSKDMIEGTPVKGKFLIAKNNSHKLLVADSVPANTKFSAKINYIKSSGIATFVGVDGNKKGNVYELVHFTVETV